MISRGIKKIVIFQTIFVVLMSFATANGDGDKRQLPNKQSGLFPFPRVGRSDAYGVKSNREIGGNPKRETMVFYPRIGRGNSGIGHHFIPKASEVDVGPAKVNGVSSHRRFSVDAMDIASGKSRGGAGSVFWLVPPTQRRTKRSAAGRGDENPTWGFMIKEYPRTNSRVGFTPRLGRDSTEVQDYDFDGGDSEAKESMAE